MAKLVAHSSAGVDCLCPSVHCILLYEVKIRGHAPTNKRNRLLLLQWRDKLWVESKPAMPLIAIVIPVFFGTGTVGDFSTVDG